MAQLLIPVLRANTRIRVFTVATQAFTVPPIALTTTEDELILDSEISDPPGPVGALGETDRRRLKAIQFIADAAWGIAELTSAGIAEMFQIGANVPFTLELSKYRQSLFVRAATTANLRGWVVNNARGN